GGARARRRAAAGTGPGGSGRWCGRCEAIAGSAWKRDSTRRGRGYRCNPAAPRAVTHVAAGPLNSPIGGAILGSPARFSNVSGSEGNNSNMTYQADRPFTLYFVRHGITEPNFRGFRCGGDLDLPMMDIGC